MTQSFTVPCSRGSILNACLVDTLEIKDRAYQGCNKNRELNPTQIYTSQDLTRAHVDFGSTSILLLSGSRCIRACIPLISYWCEHLLLTVRDIYNKSFLCFVIGACAKVWVIWRRCRCELRESNWNPSEALVLHMRTAFSKVIWFSTNHQYSHLVA